MKTINKDGSISYSVTSDVNELRENWKDFEKEAKAGKVICLSGLIGSAETIYLNNYNKSMKGGK